MHILILLQMDKVKLEARVIAMESGRQLASPSKGDEVVISGIAGSFPDSNDVTALQENLFNKVDLISDDDSRWSLSKYGSLNKNRLGLARFKSATSSLLVTSTSKHHPYFVNSRPE